MAVLRVDGWHIVYHNPGVVKELWYCMGHLDRLDGPAIIRDSGEIEWWIMGKKYTFEEYWEKQKDTEYAGAIMAYMLNIKE